MEGYAHILEMIREADTVLNNVVHRTPLDKSSTFSKRYGCEVFLKLENLQKTGSFKVRGAYYALWRRSRKGAIKECIAASSGNHAQGVAYASSLLGIKCTIVMPEHTPVAKVFATKGYGANVLLYGRTYDDSYLRALELAKERGAEFVHPFDHPDVIAGQGTIGLEVFRALREVEAVVVPVGGGGLISGIAIALKNLRRGIKVYGVQPKGAPSATLSFKKGRIVRVGNPETIADAIAVKAPGELTLSIMEELIDDMVLVDEDDIVRAMFLLLERAKCVAEPAGALALAALEGGILKLEGRKVALIISGGNVNMSLLSRVVERALLIEGREVKLRGVLPDRPGTLKSVLEILAEAKANILSIEHDRTNLNLKPHQAQVTITLELPSSSYLKELISRLASRGFKFKVTSIN
ncbi:MAG: threonine ammonia-lyase [Thermofilum sp. ex4484_15]|nr:MAG: threonine ammonia-lyase [Thermofilum sp. ex4484_15]